LETHIDEGTSAAGPQDALPRTGLGPSTAGERVEVVDIIRGVALLGILAANIRGFAGPARIYMEPHLYWPALHDRIAQAFVDVFIQGKFITIFAVLFGAGFAAQLSRIEGRGARFGGMYARRLAILAAFGLAHGLLVWFGDILLVYALTGFFLLLFFRHRPDGSVLKWAVIGYVLPLVVGFAVMLGAALAGDGPPRKPPPSPAQLAAVTETYRDGTWSMIQESRARDAFQLNWGMFPLYFPQILGLFLFGVLAWRRGFFRPLPEHLPHYRRAMLWGFVVGISGNIATTGLRVWYDLPPFAPTRLSIFVAALSAVSVPALSLGYVCAIILLYHSVKWRERLRPFGAVGRTALTNYLLQSILGTTIFYSYGLGLFGRVGPAVLLVATVIVFAIQVAFSAWWLSRWRFGPMEWLWRSLTYMKLQPLARE
jgi:uncharacterized protein